MTSHAWTPRTGPLSIGERLMLARVADAYPCPLSTVEWITQTSDTDGTERIGEVQLEMRGWLRIRRRRHCHVIEITRRAEREFPAILDPGARRRFISETRASLPPVPEVRRGGMEPDTILLACGRIAMQHFVGTDDGRRESRVRAVAIFDKIVHLSGDTGRALREALARGLDTRAQDLVDEVLGVVGEAALRTVLQQQQAEDLLDGVPVTVLH
jgi:hypothetical protein